MKIKCPCCYAENSLEAILDDQAGSELLLLLADLEPALARPLVSYMALFRSASRALSWDRALRLAREVLAMDANRQRLAAALAKTVTVLREKQGPNWKPLGNHNYLKRVLDETPHQATAMTVVNEADAPKPPMSKTLQSLMALEALKKRG